MKFIFAAIATLALATSTLAEVKLGNEVLAQREFKALHGKRVGLITNPSGVNRQLESTIEILRRAPGVQLVALFGPEHGIYGDVPAGDPVSTRNDERTGLPVHSLYGKTHKPTPEMLKGLDAVVYDLQDVGCRSYTFISTLGIAMEACAENNVEFIVLDRPNPLGGERIEGPMIADEKFRSFVSKFDIPYVYGLTTGELAMMINGEGWIKKKCKLTVIPLHGWKRSMNWSATGLPWVPTSPHIPHGDSSMFYAATGLIGELGTASIGVGYTLPFECVALAGIDGHKLAKTLNEYQLPGVRFKQISYTPFYSFYKGTNVSGVQVYLTDPRRAPLVALNFYALEALKKSANRDVFDDAVQQKKSFSMFDKVNGTDATRLALQAGTPAREIVASWKTGEEAFRNLRKKYLLY
jgi:uncharacterized protein YbbC (DUF1343 family)